MDTRTQTPTNTDPEPPVLPESERDPNSDTRIPIRIRTQIGDVADIAFSAQAGVEVEHAIPAHLDAWVGSYMAAAESAYAAGFAAGVRSTQLMEGTLTEDDLMAYEGTLQWCGVPHPKLPGSQCNRARGHVGDHADIVEDDRAGEADPWIYATIMDRWPRETGTLILDTSGPYVESAITPQGEKG